MGNPESFPPSLLSLLAWIEPRIDELSRSERNELIIALMDSTLDGFETAGIIAGLVGVTYLTDQAPAHDWVGAIGLITWQIGAALVLMSGVVGLMHLRRVRRVTLDYFRLRGRHE